LKQFLEAGKNPELLWRGNIVDMMTDYSNMVHLMMLTGQRRVEISELEWREIRTEEIFIDEGLPVAGPAIVLSSERVKNGRRHIVPLSKPAQAILFSRRRDPDQDLVFPRRDAATGQRIAPGRDRPRRSAVYTRKWVRHKTLLDAALAERGHQF